MLTPNFSSIKRTITEKGYKFFSSPMSVNIIGIRRNTSLNTFDDTICLLWYDKDMVPKIEFFPCTTKPGKHWLLNPMSSKGTAILKEGQWLGMYKIGLHNRSRPSRSYECLEQKKEADYFRDNNKDAVHDYSGKTYTGNFKTNIHRANVSGWSKFVDKWSAGCQVITGKEDEETEYNIFMKICKDSAKLFGNSFSYTLLNERDF